MTDNDIIKVLECCNKMDNGKGCWQCPYRQYCPACLTKRNEDTIDLINHQQAEIERLKQLTESKPHCVTIGTADVYTEDYEEYEKLIATIATDVLTEFVETLKAKAYPFPCAIGVEYAVTIRAIDETMKEAIGGDTEKSTKGA